MPDSLEHYHQTTSNTIFGFWIYLMTDFILFATLFAAYAVLRTSTFGGPTAHELLSPSYALSETLVLLTSSFSCAIAMLAVTRNQKRSMAICFSITFILGLAFLTMVGVEFASLVQAGNSWKQRFPLLLLYARRHARPAHSLWTSIHHRLRAASVTPRTYPRNHEKAYLFEHVLVFFLYCMDFYVYNRLLDWSIIR